MLSREQNIVVITLNKMIFQGREFLFFTARDIPRNCDMVKKIFPQNPMQAKKHQSRDVLSIFAVF